MTRTGGNLAPVLLLLSAADQVGMTEQRLNIFQKGVQRLAKVFVGMVDSVEGNQVGTPEATGSGQQPETTHKDAE